MGHLLIGTAGHVDHGKSALVQALTGKDPDRLAEEKSRGMTIDLGFVQGSLPGGNTADFIDLPGHVHYIKNMLAGTGALDVALLVVDSCEGVMAQTREHLEILSLLKTPQVIGVLSKRDLASEETLSLAQQELEEVLSSFGFPNAPILPVSSVTGQGIPELAHLLGNLHPLPREKDGKFWMPIDRVFTIAGFGTVVTGTVISGTVKVGDLLEVVPGGPCRVRGIQTGGCQRESCEAGKRAALNLAGVETSKIHRGAVLAEKGSFWESQCVNVFVQVAKTLSQPLRHYQRLGLFMGTGFWNCRAVTYGGEPLRAGEEGYIQLRLERPGAVRPGQRFLLRGPDGKENVAGGEIVDPAPVGRRLDSSTLEMLRCYRQGAPDEKVFLEAGRFPRIQELTCRFRHWKEERLSEILGNLLSEGRLLEGEGLLLTPETLEKRCEEAVDCLKGFHQGHPLEEGMSVTEFRERVPLLPLSLLDTRIQWIGDSVKRTGFTPEKTEAFRLLAERIQKKLGEGPKNLVDLTLSKREQELLERTQVIHRLTGDWVMTEADWERAKTVMTALSQKKQGVSLASFRDAMGISRKPAQMILETMDAEGITNRQGDLRFMGIWG